MNNNSNRPRRSTGKGILDMHPTQLRRGEGSNISPEQLNILKIKTEERIAAAKHAQTNEKLRKASQTERMNVDVRKNNIPYRPRIPQNERASDQRTDTVNSGYVRTEGTGTYRPEHRISSDAEINASSGNKNSTKKIFIIVGAIIAVLVAAVIAFAIIYINSDNSSDNGRNTAGYTEQLPIDAVSSHNGKYQMPFVYDRTNK